MPDRDWQADWELCEKATPGPWYAIPHPEYKNASWRVDTSPDVPWANFGQLAYMNEEDARFVTEAREALPYYLQRVKKLEAVAEAAKELLDVADRRGDSFPPPPIDDPKPYSARMQTAWTELRASLAALEERTDEIETIRRVKELVDEAYAVLNKDLCDPRGHDCESCAVLKAKLEESLCTPNSYACDCCTMRKKLGPKMGGIRACYVLMLTRYSFEKALDLAKAEGGKPSEP